MRRIVDGWNALEGDRAIVAGMGGVSYRPLPFTAQARYLDYAGVVDPEQKALWLDVWSALDHAYLGARNAREGAGG